MVHVSSNFKLCLIIVSLSIFLEAVEGKKKKSKTEEESEGGGDEAKNNICSKISCSKPPEGLQCTKTEIKNLNLIKKVGKFKGCCTAWRCQDEDGSFSTYFGMSGDDAPPNFTGDVEKQADDKGSSRDMCAEAKPKCPKPDGDDPCVEVSSKAALDFKPKGDLDSCCPTYNCTNSEGYYHVHFIMTGGKMPKASDTEQKTEKTCSKVKCAPKPEFPEEGPTCEVSTDDDSSRIKALGRFRGCCDLWKCSYDDGSYYSHFEMAAANFWIAETSFFSSSDLPDGTSISGDGIDIITEEPDDDEPNPTTVKTKTTTNSKDSDKESDEEPTTSKSKIQRKEKATIRSRKKGRKNPAAAAKGRTQTNSTFSSTQILISSTNSSSVTVTDGDSDDESPAKSVVTTSNQVQGAPIPKINQMQAQSAFNLPQESQTQTQGTQQTVINTPFQQQQYGMTAFQPPMQSNPAMEQVQAMQMQNMQNMQAMQNMNNIQMQRMMAQSQNMG